MKIGILTFHWATNYGAVLQCYALQTYLESLGHDVVIINYKPTRYDISFKWLLRVIRSNNVTEFIQTVKKEKALELFRNSCLHLTSRVVTYKNIPNVSLDLDCIISGSDQVLNTSFLTCGEGKHFTTPSYYLGFNFSGLRVGYAVSFGVVTFPPIETEIAKPYISKFDRISTREASGIRIVEKMGRNDAVVVPDPTILLPSAAYHKLANTANLKNGADFFCFFIRHIKERKSALNSLLHNKTTLWNNEDGNYTMEGWLAKIKNTKFTITDSFHCMVMCLKLHVPFAVVTELEGNTGMNDRFFTLLDFLGMANRIVYKENVITIESLYETHIDWNIIDNKLNDYKAIGEKFLKLI